MPTLEQQRIPALLHQLRYEIGVARERTARGQTSGGGSDEVYVRQCPCLISREIPGLGAKQDQGKAKNPELGAPVKRWAARKSRRSRGIEARIATPSRAAC